MKQTIKNIASLLLTCTLLAASCGCAVKSEPAPPEKDLIVVGFSQLGSESDWRIANTQSMLDALSEENGFDLLFDNAKQKQENQFLAIRNFIQQGVDYIVLAPIAETGWDSVLQEAKDAGLPVIIVDRQIQVEDESLYVSWVGSDFLKEGRTAVQWLENEISLKRMQNENIRILHIQGTDGATAQILRTHALNSAVASHPLWSIAARLQGEFTEACGYEVVRDFLETGESFNVIYSENDNMTFGAMQALDEAGLTYGPDGDIIIITFDAVHAALEECLAGNINLCVECNPMHGPRVANLIRQLEAGETPEKLVYVDETWFSYRRISESDLSERPY